MTQISISGQYEGEMTAPSSGLSFLDLRIDVDQRYPNSPVMKRVSGDFYQLNKISVPGSPPKVTRVYRESWIVNEPKVTKHAEKIEITGKVTFWKGTHPVNRLKITMPTPEAGIAPSCVVSFLRPGGEAAVYNCTKKSDAFRTLNLEIDVCKSVNQPPLMPAWDTTGHSNRPANLPQRVLTIEEAYREAGVAVTIGPKHSVIDDSNPDFESWSDAELHNAMEHHFTRLAGPWPKWEAWGLLAGTYEDDSMGGMMFDHANAQDATGKAPERQAFAIFRNHEWFKDLTAAAATTDEQAAAMRQFLFTWVHETGHAFNFIHSWEKNRPDALSWMNYDWVYDGSHEAGAFWSKFMFRFDDEELIHLRHGNRPAVIMGGDPWGATGQLDVPPGAEHLVGPPAAMASVEGEQALELVIRSKEYFEFMEPVSIELRLRNLLPDIPINLNTRLHPEHGGVVIYIRRPDGRILEYAPVMCKLGHIRTQPLTPGGEEKGPDRYSEEVLISYGRYGFYFDVPGAYYVRALYQGTGDLLIPSNVHRLRVGAPLTRELDRTAQDYFSYQVGMNLYLDGSRSPYLEKGFDLLREISDKHKDSLLGAKLSMTIANSFAQPFFQVAKTDDQESLKLNRTHKAEPSEALKFTKATTGVFEKAQHKALNLSYRQLVSQRVDCLLALERSKAAVKELEQLHRHLTANGANASVLKQVSDFAATIDTTPTHKIEKYDKRGRLWDRVRAHDQLAANAEPARPRAKSTKKTTRKTTTKKSRKR